MSSTEYQLDCAPCAGHCAVMDLTQLRTALLSLFRKHAESEEESLDLFVAMFAPLLLHPSNTHVIIQAINNGLRESVSESRRRFLSDLRALLSAFLSKQSH